MRVRLRLPDLVGDRVGVVGQVDARIVGGIRFRHLLGAVAQAHHARRLAEDQRLGQREEVDAVVVIELLRDIACELDMLLLVLAHRHMRRLVEQDVGGHQRRIGVEAERRGLAVFACLVLELRHPIHPADARDAIEHPGELGVGGHRTLQQDDVLPVVDAGRHQRRGAEARIGGELLGLLEHRDRMHIDDAIDALEILLQRDPVLDRAEIVAECESARGLDAREDAFHEGSRSQRLTKSRAR
jgi:hypothetical protein